MGKNKKYAKLNIEDIKESILKGRKKYSDKIPSNIEKNFDIDEIYEGKNVCYRMRPKGLFNGTYIVYLYGSYTCNRICQEQWNFIAKLSIDTGCGLFVPMYPLAPEHSCKDVFKMLIPAYSHFCMGHDVEKVILLGDSFGAGLALSLTQLSWKEGFRKPDRLIMLSPIIDTELFDKKLEKQLFDGNDDNKYWLTKEFAEFVNTYWVKDYAAKTEYTSPFYGDYTDLCDDVCVFTSNEDRYYCYAREFYKKAKNLGVNARFFEFSNEPHNFIVFRNTHEANNAYGYLRDVINNTYEQSLTDIYSIKLSADWAKKYPDDIKDDWSEDFLRENDVDFSLLPVKIGKINNLMLAATASACNKIVRKYIMEYPNCSVINLGCRLENTFSRLDNGRIQWYNIDSHNIISVRRGMYGEREREKTIGRAIMDFSWMDEIGCDRNKGVIFVCKDVFPYYKINQVKNLIEKIREKFPGAELVFSASTKGSNIINNLRYRKKSLTRIKKKLAVDDAQELFNSWRSDIQIIAEEPVMKYFDSKKETSLLQKIAIKYNMITYNHKVIRLRVGEESYDIKL